MIFAKPIFAFLILILILIYSKSLKGNLLVKFGFILIFLGGIFFVFFPTTLTTIATFFGIGRGTDLLLYMMVIIFYFSFIKIYAKQRKTDERLTKVIRRMAIDSAKKNHNTDEKPS